MSIREAIFVRVDDWEGLYIDGDLVDQNHVVDLTWSLNGETVSFQSRNGTDAEDQYVTEEGGFPETYLELMEVNSDRLP